MLSVCWFIGLFGAGLKRVKLIFPRLKWWNENWAEVRRQLRLSRSNLRISFISLSSNNTSDSIKQITAYAIARLTTNSNLLWKLSKWEWLCSDISPHHIKHTQTFQRVNCVLFFCICKETWESKAVPTSHSYMCWLYLEAALLLLWHPCPPFMTTDQSRRVFLGAVIPDTLTQTGCLKKTKKTTMHPGQSQSEQLLTFHSSPRGSAGTSVAMRFS